MTDIRHELPTKQQLKVIGYIEWNLDGVKWTGATKQEAQKFISDHIESSRKARHDAMMRAHDAQLRRELYDFTHRSTPRYRQNATSNDMKHQREDARRQHYEEYIEDASWAYAYDANDDGFGGFAADRAARRAMPYDEFCRWHDWGD